MYCAECGTANQIGAETCEVCGLPLGPASGPGHCQACGAPVAELDRYCRTCGASQPGAAGTYESGPSFVDDSNLEIDPSDLPPWLRDFTQTGADGAAVRVSGAPVVEQALPSWLRAARPAEPEAAPMSDFPPAAAPVATAAPAPIEVADDSFSFISDDDLPEWLRALGDEPLDAAAEPQMAEAPPPPAPAAISVPTVSRAWLSRPRAAGPATESASDFTPLDDRARMQRPVPVQTVEAATPAATPERQPAVPVAAEKQAPNRLRLVLLALLLVVLIVVIVLVLGKPI